MNPGAISRKSLHWERDKISCMQLYYVYVYTLYNGSHFPSSLKLSRFVFIPRNGLKSISYPKEVVSMSYSYPVTTFAYISKLLLSYYLACSHSSIGIWLAAQNQLNAILFPLSSFFFLICNLISSQLVFFFLNKQPQL